MLIYLVALAQSLVYLAAVPVCGAFCVSSRGGLHAGSGTAVFRGRNALRRARRAMARRAKKRKTSVPDLKRVFNLIKRLKLAKIALRGTLALGDAAATALACGALTSLAASLRGKAEALEIQGMIRARAGQIMLAAARSGIDEIRGRIAHGQASD